MKLVNGRKYAVIGLVAVLGIIIIALGWYVINWNNMHSQNQISKFTEILPHDRVFYLPLLQSGSGPAQVTNI